MNAHIASLPVLQMPGENATSFLHGIVTSTMDRVSPEYRSYKPCLSGRRHFGQLDFVRQRNLHYLWCFMVGRYINGLSQRHGGTQEPAAP